MISHFHGVVVDLTDFEAGVGDYARLLGQESDWIETNERTGRRSALFPLANMQLELRDGEAADGPGSSGLTGLRLGCDDADDFAAELATRGIGVRASLSESAIGPEPDTVRRWQSTPIELGASRSIAVELISDEDGSGPRPWGREAETSRRAGGAVEGAIQALDHVVVFSADPDSTRDFYGAGLGIRLALDRTFEERGVRLLFFRVGGTTIEIGGRVGAEVKPDAEDRFGGLAWQTPDIDATHARLRADRFDISEIRTGNKPGTRVCTVRDPVHGVPTLLIEPVS